MAHTRAAFKWAAGALAFAATSCAGYAGVTWLRYGHPARARDQETDPLLDRFMPVYDVVDRHHIDVAAPAGVVFSVACEQDLMALPIVRAIFKAREVMLGSDRDTAPHPRGLLALATSIGWGVLSEAPGREIVLGAVTQPWRANVVFRSLPPDDFIAFDEPEHVKIVWTLRADPVDENASIFRTETRAVATDAAARSRFRRYWSFLSPGIIVIRRASLRPVKAQAECRWARQQATA